MTDIINRDAFVSEIASRANFTKKDVEIILDVMRDIFIDAVMNNGVIKVRGLFKLYSQVLPARKGRGGISLPPTTRVIMRVAENIRFAEHREREQYE